MHGKTMADLAKDLKDSDFGSEEEVETGEPVETETPTNPEPTENLNNPVEKPTEDNPVVDPPADVQPHKVETTPPATTEFDPVSFVDTLTIPDDQKKIMRDGFLRQADYTRKTQGLAHIAKEYEEYITHGKPLLEKLYANPTLLNQILGIDTPATTDPQNPEVDDIPPEDPKEYAAWVEGRIIKKIQAQSAEEQERKQQEDAERQQWETRKRDADQAELLDPRLKTDEKFQTIIAGIVTQDSRYTSGQISAVQATKDAIAYYEGIVGGIVNKAKQDLVNKAKTTKPLIGSETSPVTPVSGKPRTMREAYNNVKSKGLID